MDLLAPWKMCLQCLPVFSSDPPRLSPPPPPSQAVAAHATSESSDASTKNPAENDFQEEMKPVAKGDTDHDALQEVQAPQDVEFTTSGLLSPLMPTPIGLGYVAGQHTPSHHIHHQVNSQPNKGHSFFHIHSHDNAPPLHPISDSMSNPLLSSQSEGDGGKQEAHHHAHHTTTLPLEASQSTPVNIELLSRLHGENDNSDEDSVIDGSSSTLKSSQSEPIDGIGTMRVRRRDQLKHQLKDLHNQLKQGGHLLKEEGSKHLQNMVTTINKQAQQIEESGSFFMVPRIRDAS